MADLSSIQTDWIDAPNLIFISFSSPLPRRPPEDSSSVRLSSLLSFLLLALAGVSAVPSELRVPDAPESVRVRTTSNAATLWWEPPASSREVLVRGYTVEYGIGAPSRRIVIEGAETNSFTVNDLVPNTSYVFALNAYNEAEGEDGEKVFVSATTQQGTGEGTLSLWPPTAVRGVARGGGVVDVSWKDPNPEENSVHSRLRHYIIQYGPYQSDALQKVRSNSRNIKLTGLLPAKEYEVAVKVVADDGRESPWSIRDVVVTPTDPTAAVSRYDWICNFTKDSCGLDKDGWLHAPTGTPPPHTSSLTLEIANGPGRASISSPPLHLQNSVAVCLRFNYLLKQTNDGDLNLELTDEKSGAKTTLLQSTLAALPTDQWTDISLPVQRQRHAFKVTLSLSWTRSSPYFSLSSFSLESGACSRRSQNFDGLPGIISLRSSFRFIGKHRPRSRAPPPPQELLHCAIMEEQRWLPLAYFVHATATALLLERRLWKI